ncbi:pilus assembly PilX family protein [Marichromatium bheemlicum]|uniref:Pilus assembly protein n=1 Tax=Marichromatium bheemlicum TaxID=365339 RepID=A0ABX1I2U7_9GAMM|nr:pilus assembly protein [Marichromatium bheemlicum]NKN31670.1 pilus assembly protein [Marichromatium bheemlicum]
MTPHIVQHQRGAVLIISLIFLAILTLIATTGALRNTQQERMSIGVRNYDLAFQAAEAALAEAHDKLTGTANIAEDLKDWAIGYDPNNTPNYRRDTFGWEGRRVFVVETKLEGLGEDPRYIIECLDDEKTPTEETCDSYRVTARGMGADSDSVVILQSVYEFKE